MTSYWYVLLIPAALLAGWLGVAHDAREQTVFLERIAELVEHTRTFPPETERAIQGAMASMRQRLTPLDQRLELRQRRAIGRIKAALSATELAQTSGAAVRDGRRRLMTD